MRVVVLKGKAVCCWRPTQNLHCQPCQPCHPCHPTTLRSQQPRVCVFKCRRHSLHSVSSSFRPFIMSSRSWSTKLTSLIFAGHTTAASLYSPIRREESSMATSTTFNFTNAADPYHFNVVDFWGPGSVIYVANITVDGVSYEVTVLLFDSLPPNAKPIFKLGATGHRKLGSMAQHTRYCALSNGERH